MLIGNNSFLERGILFPVFLLRRVTMRQSDYEKQYTKEIKNALPIGIVSLVIFIITGMGAFWLYQKSAKEIGNNYEIMEVVAVEKHKNHPVRGSEKYYIHGRNMDGYEQMYWVRERVYNAVEIGDVLLSISTMTVMAQPYLQ